MGRCVRLATVESKYARTCRKGGELGVFPVSPGAAITRVLAHLLADVLWTSEDAGALGCLSREARVNARGHPDPRRGPGSPRGTRERRRRNSRRHAAAETAGNFLRRRREGTERSLLSAREDMRVFTLPTGGRCERTRGREDPARTRPHLWPPWECFCRHSE